MTPNTVRADTIGYKVSLLRVAPGQESAVANRLNTSIKRGTKEDPVCLLKLFGRFDICAVYKTTNYGDGPSKYGPIPGILGANKINAFHWLCPGESHGLDVQKSEGHVWAISFFRFNEHLVKRFGASIEIQLATEWRRHIPNEIAMDVLGTTGWAELILLLRGRMIETVTRTLSSITQLIAVIEERNRPSAQILPAKTLSMVGIDFSLTEPAYRARLKRELNEPFTEGKGAFPSCSVTCAPAAMNAVRKYGSRRFGEGAQLFGSADILFQPKKGRWGTFVAHILDLRKKPPGEIYSTAITVKVAPKESPSVTYKAPRRRPLRIPLPASKCFSKWGPTLEPRLTNLYYALSNLLQDPLIGDCFEDLRPIAEAKLPALLNTLPLEDDDQRQSIYELVEILGYATEERAHGAYLSLEHLESGTSPTKGGIQRILTAAEFIPRSLLKRVNKDWYGFIVAGYHNEFFSSHYETLNLPIEYLFKPEEWCGLLHETGHAAFWDNRFYDMDGAEMKRLITHLAPAATTDSQEYTKWKELAWEIGADMFDLYFCYGTEIDPYLSNIWPYVTRHCDMLLSEHYRRYFVVFEFWKHLLCKEAASFGKVIDLNKDIEEFRARILKLPGSLRPEENAEREALVAFSGMAAIAEAFYKRFRHFAKPRDLSAELKKAKMKDALKSVIRGEPWLEPITAPDTFILGLKRERSLTLSARIAAIVSLWHSANRAKPIRA